MAIELVFESHSTTVDNEQGRATAGPSVQKRKATQRPPHLQVFGDRLRAGFHFFNDDDVAAAPGAIRG